VYALRSLKEAKYPGGQAFLPGQTRGQLSRDEAAELLLCYPDCFEPANPKTARLAAQVRETWFEADGPIGEIYAASRMWIIAVLLGSVTVVVGLLGMLR
jgi:hypothetical protein